jgi:D-alanine-D-alanine ligase-like ATP-grasp enzyme
MNTNSRPKELLVVNTGYSKKKFIFTKLKRLGYKITCLNKTKSSWVEKNVDNWILADTYNHDIAIERVMNYYGKDKPDGIITFWEDDVLLTSKLVDKLGLIGIPYTSAENTRNKFKFREFCEQNNLPAPKHVFINSKKDLEEITKKLTFPIVLKPAYGSLTAMVVKVETPEDLEKTYNYVIRNISTEVETALNDGLNIFAEEYIDGDEVDIDIILQNGKMKLAIISDNFDKSRGKFFLDVGQVTPSTLPEEQQTELVEMTELILEKLGIYNGCVHFEAKYSSKGPVPLESNLRMGGDYVYSYIKSAWDIDLIELIAKVATGEYVPPMREIEPQKYVIGKDLSSEYSGIISELNIEDEFEELPFVEDMMLYKEIGDATLVPPVGFETMGWITVSGQSYPDANDNLTKALELINFSVAKFDAKSFSGRNREANIFANSTLNKRILKQQARVNYMSSASLKELDIALVTNVDKFEDPDKYNYVKSLIKDFESEGVWVNYINTNNPRELFTKIKPSEFDLVLNFVNHNNNKSALDLIQALEIIGVPFTGADSFITNFVFNKIKVKKLLKFHTVSTPNWDYYYQLEDQLDEDLEYPLIVKPATGQSKEDIDKYSIVSNYKEYETKVKHLITEEGYPALAEEYIDGKEVEVLIIGNLETSMEIAKMNIINFKTNSDIKIITPDIRKNSITVTTKIKQKIYELISEISMDLFNILDARDYLKVEFRLDSDNNPYVIDVDTNPFLTLTGRNTDKLELYKKIIKATIDRYKQRK